MGAEDVGAFLASVGSPLVASGEAQKVLPASAVVQLLGARIEALAAPEAPAATSSPVEEPRSIEMDEDLAGALHEYAHATAHYTYTSAVSTIVSQLSAAMDGVNEVQAALDARDWTRLPELLPTAQEHLQLVGIEVDFLHNRLQDVRNGSQMHSVVGARLLAHCEKLLHQMHTQADADWERAVQVFPASRGAILAVQESTMDPESTNIPSLVNLWEFARAMNMDESVAERITTLLVDNIVHKLLGDVQSWSTAQSTTADDILTQLQFTAQPTSSPPGTAIPAVVDMLTFLRTVLFVPSAQDKPAVEDASLAPTLQVVVAQRFVPRLLAELKPYLLRCLPNTDVSLHAYNKAVETVSQLALQVHNALVEYGYVREAKAAGTMVRRPGWAPMEPLSDLRQWTEQLPSICTQRVLGDVLDHVRATILRTDDKAWDTVTVKQQVEEVTTQVPKAEAKAAPKVEAKEAPAPSQGPAKNQPRSAAPAPAKPPSPLSTQRAAQSVAAPKPEPKTKGKKPTLGSVKRLGAVPVSAAKPAPAAKPATPAPPPPAPAVPEPQDDDWGWGDDDFEDDKDKAAPASSEQMQDDWEMDDAWDTEPTPAPSSTAPNAATQAPPQDDASDWGWGSDEEVEDMLGSPTAPTEAPTTQDSATKSKPPVAPANASEAPAAHNDSALDAWDWNEPDEESPLPEAAPLPPVQDTPEPAKRVVTCERIVSQRCEAVAEQAQQQFAQLAHTSDPRLVQVIQEAVLACFQLYRALMPTVHAASLQHIPLLSMLFASDCDYLAEEMRSMAQRQSCSDAASSGASSLHTALLHEAQATQDTGAQWRDAQLAVQTHALQECLDQADEFARTDDDARFAMCERAVAQVDHILQHLANVWMPVLAKDPLVSLLGELVHSVFARVQDSVEDLEDIGEAESMRLAALCRTLLEAQTALFARAARCDIEAAGALAATVVPNWFKFSYLPELLTGSLADIEFLVFESGGALLDYGREEIMALIRALFADTHNRRQLLDRIQRAPWASTQAGLA
ncbi:ribosome biogenesis protein ytm1 [Malassezia furfur]|uniref:Ribosome biogenesis protein ytm1 n=1 Tax=Malassezia furfur TaxID=55194 RepID=A0ABY8EMX9_MALFU|nr:hypothetical protein CBS14141_001345 [Malassezia furfur]WFD46354.1 ribosome biogenesis protein ytm1 [Malassezia furfur]